MKLDPKAIRYLTSEDFRVLTAVCLSFAPHLLLVISSLSDS